MRDYVRAQPARHPNEAIPGWTGDNPEYDPSTQEEWISEQRMCGTGGKAPARDARLKPRLGTSR